MRLDKFMDIPPSKVVKQQDAISIAGLGNLSTHIAGNLQEYIEEGGQGISSPWEWK